MKFLTHKIYLRNDQGQFVGAITRAKVACVLATVAFILAGLAYSFGQARAGGCATGGGSHACPSTDQGRGDGAGHRESVGCRFVDGVCDLTDDLTRFKVEVETRGGHPLRGLKTSQAEKKDVKGILDQVCTQNGYNDAVCPHTLYGMAMQESYFGKVMVGDGGRSHGYFHIMDYHHVSTSCSEDLACSADWTLKRMISKGYDKNWAVAVMSHNGTPNTKATKNYLAQVKKKMALY